MRGIITRSAAVVAGLLLAVTACGTSDPAPRATSRPGTGQRSSTPGSSTAKPTSSDPATTTPGPDPAPGDAARCSAGVLGVSEQAALLVFASLNGNPGEAAASIQAGYGGIFVTSATAHEAQDGTLRSLLAEQGSPVLVAIDQEGGRVQRLAGPVTPLPSARQMHQTMTTTQIRDAAATLGGQLLDLGVTVDFAPSADVSSQSDDEVIGDRSFSNDPDEAAADAAAFAQGLTDAGVLPVFKHFPGHGHGSGDSHTGLVRTPPVTQLRADDLVAFEKALQQVPSAAVMVGHLIVPGLTGDQPASVSPEAITALLRDEMGFDGLVITDDLGGMAGIRDLYSTPQAAVHAAIAGADLLLVPQSQGDAVVQGLTDAVDQGRLPPNQLETSAQRVIDAQRRPGCSSGEAVRR